MKNTYLFTSERLGFRTWEESDIPGMIRINSDPVVMEFFPEIPSEEKTREFVYRMQRQFEETGFCYFAVDKLENGNFIGFIGFSEQTFEAEFTPCIDIGWRLAKEDWNLGYATEGAKRCLQYAFEVLELREIMSICPEVNKNSEAVMKKIGMQKIAVFEHPLLQDYDHLKRCVLFKISSNSRLLR